MTPRKVLILMSDTGGGHRSAAEAIAEAMAERYGEATQVSIVDAWMHHTPFPINRLGGAYSWLVSDGLWLWKLLWKLGESEKRTSSMGLLFGPLVQRPFGELLRREEPDLVVSVHCLLTHVPRWVMGRVAPEIPFITVVTDLVSAPAVWFCPDVDLCIVPTEPARRRGIGFGMPPEKIEVVGLPVGLKFARPLATKTALRDKLNLAQEKPVVLVVGGAEGMGRVGDIARAIATSGLELQMMIVAGRNRKLQQQLEAITWEVPTHVFGFVTNMPELMGASDVIVTKAGPATISEACIVGLPIILSGFVPGQENGNIPYVLNNGIGTYAEEPQRIAAVLAEWLRPGNPALADMAGRASQLGRPQAAFDIARRILESAG
jgi:1,2-diacylglycerol 3-beta-galactosyltransferase